MCRLYSKVDRTFFSLPGAPPTSRIDAGLSRAPHPRSRHIVWHLAALHRVLSGAVGATHVEAARPRPATSLKRRSTWEAGRTICAITTSKARANSSGEATGRITGPTRRPSTHIFSRAQPGKPCSRASTSLVPLKVGDADHACRREPPHDRRRERHDASREPGGGAGRCQGARARYRCSPRWPRIQDQASEEPRGPEDAMVRRWTRPYRICGDSIRAGTAAPSTSAMVELVGCRHVEVWYCAG